MINISKSPMVNKKAKVISGICYQVPFWISQAVIMWGGFYLYQMYQSEVVIDLFGFLMSLANLFGFFLVQRKKTFFEVSPPPLFS